MALVAVPNQNGTNLLLKEISLIITDSDSITKDEETCKNGDEESVWDHVDRARQRRGRRAGRLLSATRLRDATLKLDRGGEKGKLRVVRLPGHGHNHQNHQQHQGDDSGNGQHFDQRLR